MTEVVLPVEEYDALRELESTVRYIDADLEAADFDATDWGQLTLAYTRKRMLLARLYEMGERP